jgi:hypothetical protein
VFENRTTRTCAILQTMTPEQFLNRCKVICHVGPAGVWDKISANGFRTAEQLILEADLSNDERKPLLTQPRAETVHLRVKDQDVVLRDQAPFLARKDIKAALEAEVDVSDWIELLNQRVYFFTDQTPMQKFLEKYVETDGPQDVVWLSPLKVVQTEGIRLELSSQNSGAVARRTGPAKIEDAGVPLFRFPDKRPTEVTMVGGLSDLSSVFRAERCNPDGTRELLT